MSEEKVEVRIRRSLYEKARRYIEEVGGFESVEEFIEYVLETALEEAGEAFTEEDKKKIEQHLKDLGYM